MADPPLSPADPSLPSNEQPSPLPERALPDGTGSGGEIVNGGDAGDRPGGRSYDGDYVSARYSGGGYGAATPTPPPRVSHRGRVAIEWVAVIAVTVVLTFLIKTFLVEAFVIPSGSMEPTLKVHDRILVDKVGYTIHRGDIIVFDKPPRDTEPGTPHLVKRVIGLPGDHVSLQGGYVYIDGKLLDEHWLPKADQGVTCAPYTGPSNCMPWSITVPAGDYLVMGDNRTESYDSRYFGPISENLVVGKAFMKIWPLGSITLY